MRGGAVGSHPTVQRLKRTRAAQSFKHRVWDPARLRRHPLLSVVVPFHDAVDRLERTLVSIDDQRDVRLEVVLVDDGSTDGSRALADAWAAAHRNVRVVAQEHRGVGAARRLGVSDARGDYLTFCDADDLVATGGYSRLVEALERSGSDLAIGSVATQVKGRFSRPPWAHRSNAVRALGTTLAEVPELLGNVVLGDRVFRRSFWDEHGLGFTRDDERSDASLLVASLLAARTVDVIPAVVYRWAFREDGRSLLQRDLKDKDRVADRVRSVREAGQLLVAHGDERLQQVFFAEVLHSVVPDLVRAAVCRDDGYWEALTTELRSLVEVLSPETFTHVPVEDRIMAWLAAQDQRPTTEAFLEYAFDNQNGFPYRLDDDGRPHIALPFIGMLAEAPERLVRVADADLRFRTRLVRVGWSRPGVLRIEGAAFAEYLDDRSGPSEITLLVTERSTGETARVATTPYDTGTNVWAGRASEDHTGAGFWAEIDLATLPRPTEGHPQHDVAVELRIGGSTFTGHFGSRHVGGSAGLLPAQEVDGVLVAPTWRDHRGLGIVAGSSRRRGPLEAAVAVERFDAVDGTVVLEGTTPGETELRLVGPRGVTPWVPARREGDRFHVELPVVTDEWGLGATSVPADWYDVQARVAGGQEARVAAADVLRETLPAPVDSGDWTFHPSSTLTGLFDVRIVPSEWRDSRPSLLRRRLRDEVYPAAKEQPLLDTVLFETFAGKGTGDNPGAICAELARRDLGLDLVYSQIDRSTVVPDGARGVVRWSPEWFELLGRARYLVVNASLPYFFRKREGQLYYQTWHGSPLKRIAHDRPHLDFFNWHHRRQLLVARSGWDWLLSQSEFCSWSLSSAFRYEGPVMEVGYPRNDVLSSPEAGKVRERVRRQLGIAEGTTAVLYAPTWRDNARVGAVFNKVLYLDPHQVVQQVPDSVVLVRGHYNSVGAAEERDEDARVMDVTRYPDIADLYLAADVLVTDYSSVFFDFSITDKPMVFLAPDLLAYRDDNRGFYLDYHETVPGPVVEQTSEVIAAINAPDTYAERREAFRREFNPLDDGHAAARVVDRILEQFPIGGVGAA